MPRALIIAAAIPGAFLHMAAHLVPALWPANDRYVTWLHRSWHAHD